jgi:hypothetical protein
VAEFEGAMAIEAEYFPSVGPYDILMSFFGCDSTRRNNEEDNAHKTCVLLSWLECAGVLSRARAARQQIA